jgi:SNF2 family DNA or RNA helicase
MNREKMLQIGWYLYNIDTVEERNHAGLNKIDHAIWTNIANASSDRQIAKTIYKYRKQFEANLEAGEIEELETLAKSQGHYFVTITIGNGTITAKIGGDRNKTAFSVYLSTCKTFGFKYDNANQLWYVNYNAEPSWFPMFIETFNKANIDTIIETLEASVDQPKKEVRSNKPTVRVYKREDGKYAFNAPYNANFVALFDNKKGRLSGITEYDPNTKERLTTSISLVNEAIEKIKETIPELEVIVNKSIIDETERFNAQQEFFKQPIPAVVKYLNPAYKLYPHQNEGVHFLNKTNGKALVSFQMGTGKTLITQAYAVSHGLRVLVVCPKVVRRTWLQEAKKFFPSYYTNCIELSTKHYDKKNRPDLTGCQLVTVNYESADKFEKEIMEGNFDILVIDESHRAKDGKTKAAKTLLEWSKKFAHRILLTGTSIKNKKEELFTQISMIDPSIYTRKQEVKMETIGGLWHRLQSFYIVKNRKEALKDLPETTTQIVEFDCDSVPADPTCFEEVAQCKAALAIAKVPQTLEMIINILENSDDKALVFSDSVEAAQLIAAALGDLAILHHGQQSDDVREASKARFQEEDCDARVFVSTRQSLAVGATLTAANHVIFNDICWNYADMAQAESRAIRIGQKKAIFVYWMVAQNSLYDAKITQIVLKKYTISKSICEGKQLTDEDRKFMDEKVSMDDVYAAAKKAKK